MKSLYEDDEKCMDFANEEIIQYLVEPLIKHSGLEIEVEYDGFICKQSTKEKEITHIMLNGEQGDFFIAI